MAISKKTVLLCALAAAILLLLAAFFPYLKAEYLTARHGDEFAGLERQTNMLDDSKYYKVLSYSKEKAAVFYVSDTGDVLTFRKENDGWKMDEWKTIWSTAGSADSFCWPYYR